MRDEAKIFSLLKDFANGVISKEEFNERAKIYKVFISDLEDWITTCYELFRELRSKVQGTYCDH